MATPAHTKGFGFDADESPYHFAVIVERDQIVIEERFGSITPAETEPPRVPVRKATLDGYRWTRIADVAKAEFNRRLQAAGTRLGSWSEGETVVAPHLGKELTVLAWVVEEADPTVIPNMIANWRGLAPEERWWLYTTINATTGHPEHGRDRGWRKAIKIALAENPAVAATPGSFTITEADAKRPNGHRPNRNRPKQKPRLGVADGAGPTQLTLLEEDRA
jgi:hypothetical protein